MNAAERQAAYRARRQQKMARMDAGLAAIILRLDGNDKPLAAELRKLAEEALE